MSRVFDFGIGITAEGADDAASAIRGVIKEVSALSEGVGNASSLDLSGIFGDTGSFDPSLLMPDNDALQEMAKTLKEIGGVLGGISDHMGILQELEIPDDWDSLGEFVLIGDALEEFVPIGEEVVGVFEEVVGVFEEVVPPLEEICGQAAATAECLEETAQEVEELGDVMEEVVGKGPSLVGMLGEVGAVAGEIVGAFADLGNAIMSLGLSQIEHDSVRLNASLGQTREQSLKFRDESLDLAKATKLNAQRISDLRVGLAEAGMRFDQNTEAGQRQIKTYAHLNQTYGISAEKTRELAGTMHATGMSIVDLVGVGRRFEKEFQVPGIIKELPGITKTAMEAQAQFGSLVGSSSRDISVNIMRMSGTYSRALGVTAAEAAKKAAQTFMHFQGQIESYEDLFLGLADDFTPLQKAFLETGMDMQEMDRLMHLATKSPGEYANEVLRIRDSMDPQMGQRFFRQMLRNSDEATRALLTQQNVLQNGTKAERLAEQKRITAQKEAAIEQKAFNGMITELRKNAVDANEMFQSLLGVFSEEVKSTFADAIIEGLTHLNKIMPTIIKGVRDFGSYILGDKKTLEGYGETVTKIAGFLKGLFTEEGQNKFSEYAGYAVAFGVGLTTVTTAFMSFYGIVKPVWGMLKGAWKVLSIVGKHMGTVFTTARAAGPAVGRMAGFMRGFGAVLGKVIVPLGLIIAGVSGVIEMVKRMAGVLSDPNATGMEIFKGIVGSVFAGLWEFADTLFLGIPTKIAEAFGMKGDVGAAIMELTNWLGEIFGSVNDLLGISGWGDDIKTSFNAIGKSITEAFAPAVSFFKDFVNIVIEDVTKSFDKLFILFPELQEAWKQTLAIFGMDDELNRIAELDAQTIQSQEVAARDLQNQRASGMAPSEADIRAGDLIHRQITTAAGSDGKGAGTHDLDYMMQDYLATTTAAQQEMDKKTLEMLERGNFAGATDRMIELGGLMKAFAAEQGLNKEGGAVTSRFAARIAGGSSFEDIQGENNARDSRNAGIRGRLMSMDLTSPPPTTAGSPDGATPSQVAASAGETAAMQTKVLAELQKLMGQASRTGDGATMGKLQQQMNLVVTPGPNMQGWIGNLAQALDIAQADQESGVGTGPQVR